MESQRFEAQTNERREVVEKLELMFTYEKETKNTVRYQEGLGDEAHSSWDIAVGSLYVQKEALGETVPRGSR